MQTLPTQVIASPRPTAEQLHDPAQYTLVESFLIDNMMDFIRRELHMKPQSSPNPSKKPTGITVLKLLVMAAVGGVIGYELTSLLANKQTDFGWLGQIIPGFVGFFLLLPIHEFIHGLAFRYVGAPKVGYGYSLKSLMVYAYCQAFPLTLRELAFVAVMPFLVITSGLLIGLVFWPAYTAFLVSVLVFHTTGCIGDLALILFWRKNKTRLMYTYDDVENKRMTYFFEKNGNAVTRNLAEP